MNETPSPLQTPALDPVDAAIQAALNPDDSTPAPVAETATEGQPEAPKPEERKARQYAEAAEAKRRAAQAESRARQQAKEARDQQEALKKEKAELEALFSGAKGDKKKLTELMHRMGMSLEDIARTHMELDLTPVSADTKAEQALDEARKLRKELEDREAKFIQDQKRAQGEVAFQKYVGVIKDELGKDTADTYELVKEFQAYPAILDQCFKVLSDNNLTDTVLTPEEEITLIIHCAKEVESQLFQQIEQKADIFKKSAKAKKLLGISQDTSKASSDAPRNNDFASLDPDSVKILENLSQDTPQAKGNRFITNDTTVSSRPAQVISSRQSDMDREIDELVRAAGGKKPL